MKKPKRALEVLQTEGPLSLTNKTVKYFINHYLKRGFIKLKRGIWSLYLSRWGLSSSQLQEFGSKHGRIWYDAPETRIEYTDPVEQGAPTVFRQYTAPDTPERRYVCELSSCYLIGSEALVFLNGNELVLETHGGSREFFLHELAAQGWQTSLKKLIIQAVIPQFTTQSSQSSFYPSSPIFPLVPTYNHDYYHWIVEYLPQLRMLELYEEKTGKNATILIADDPPSFVSESLSLLGYNSNRYVEWKEKKQKIKDLVITKRRFHEPEHKFHHSLEDYSWLKEKMRSAVRDNHREGHGLRLYISRQEADRERKVTNYEEVIAELKLYGFRSIVLESLPLKKQIQLFKQAEVIIGPHGAGFANMLFADDPLVIELLPETRLRPDFYLLSDVMGYKYECIINPANSNHNMTVDIDSLHDRLETLDL